MGNPKSLASLADDLDNVSIRHNDGRISMPPKTYYEIKAALRAPTIAAVTDEQVKAGAAAAVEWLRGFEYLRIQLTQSDRSFGTGLTRAILQAALSTPSPDDRVEQNTSWALDKIRKTITESEKK